jgi:hypothetical protein
MMKRILACLMLAGACLLAPQYAYADPPQDVALSYSVPEQTLTVGITHKSPFTGMHYIKQVDIRKNNGQMDTKTYTSQPDKKSFAYTYKIPATANDTLEVTATCNIRGSKTVPLTVGEPKK